MNDCCHLRADCLVWGHLLPATLSLQILDLPYLAVTSIFMIDDFKLKHCWLLTQVVVTNQMTTMVAGDRASQQIPALGESWAHVPTQRVILYWHEQQRHAVLYKSASIKQADVRFQITVSRVVLVKLANVTAGFNVRRSRAMDTVDTVVLAHYSKGHYSKVPLFRLVLRLG